MGINNFQSNITAEEINGLELRTFEGDILIVENMHQLKSSVRKLEGSNILGFDTETRPSFKKGKKNRVSLLQLSGKHTACLFRINRIGLPGELTEILSDNTIIKAGVAIHDDIKALSHFSKIRTEGFVDLQKYVKEFGIESSGLKKLTAIILGFRISKSQQVTDWEAEILSEAQKAYAATDAWVCYEIYNKLVKNNFPFHKPR